jgi:hypothetical protein
MELGVNGAVDHPGLEAGVLIAKGYRGCHDDRVSRWFSAAKRQQQLSLVWFTIIQAHQLAVAHQSE